MKSILISDENRELFIQYWGDPLRDCKGLHGPFFLEKLLITSGMPEENVQKFINELTVSEFNHAVNHGELLIDSKYYV